MLEAKITNQEAERIKVGGIKDLGKPIATILTRKAYLKRAWVKNA